MKIMIKIKEDRIFFDSRDSEMMNNGDDGSDVCVVDESVRFKYRISSQSLSHIKLKVRDVNTMIYNMTLSGIKWNR